MAREGYAAASYPEGKTPPKKFEQFASARKIAVDQKTGIWATCPAISSPDGSRAGPVYRFRPKSGTPAQSAS